MFIKTLRLKRTKKDLVLLTMAVMLGLSRESFLMSDL